MNHSLAFLDGGGEMGKLTRNYDWSKTSLGAAETWPQSLRSTLSILLNSKFPMFLFWGPELLCFYNDAYRPSLGNAGKHPMALGNQGAIVWPEIWTIIKPLIDQVMAGGGATWSEDQLIPIYRNGLMEDVYWTFSYSPVNDENDVIAGVFVTCNETTQKVRIIKELEESKEQLRFAIDASELGTWDYNPITKKFIGNERLKSWLGLDSRQEIELRSTFDCIAERDRAAVENANLLALQYDSGGLYEVEYTIVHPASRTERVVRAKGRVWFNEEKRPYRFNGTLEDITEYVQARNKLEESEVRFRTMAEDSEILITVSDENGLATYFSKAWVLLTGRPVKDLLNFGWKDLLHADDHQRFVNKYLEAYKNKQSFTEEFRIRTKDGSYKWLYVKGPPRFRSNGAFAGYISSFIDITERKHAEESLELKNAQLQKTNNDLDNFIYTASHDLKAPILNMEGLLNTFSFDSNENLSEDQKSLVGMMYQSIERFKKTISNLTEISKVQSLEEPDHEMVDLEEVLLEIYLDISDLIKKYTPVVVKQYEIKEMYYSKKNIRSIIYNLISNALKYSSPDRTPEILIATKKQNNGMMLSVSDNGLGLSEENQKKIFGMFKRAHQHVEGSGIGLYVIKRMIENAGGKIEVQSQENKGSTFTVYFQMMQ